MNKSNVFSPSQASTSSLFSPGQKTFATQRWNIILSVFYEQMPLTRHWRLLWPHDNSFSGREAVDFLLIVLPKLCIGKNISRITCFRLLEKFMKLGFIYNVRTTKDLEFIDNNITIFRFNAIRIEYEINKTSESTLNGSNGSSSPIRRSQTSLNADPCFAQSENVFQHSSGNNTSSASFFTKSKNQLYSSFRKLKRTNAPVFHFPPPPKSPPPPSFQSYSSNNQQKCQFHFNSSQPMQPKFHIPSYI